jgi:predicted CopG family antitoxin
VDAEIVETARPATGLQMHKRITITLDEAVYKGLYRTVGKRCMSQFIEDLLRPHVLDTSLDDGYRAMAADKAREAEAMEWCNAIVGDVSDSASTLW